MLDKFFFALRAKTIKREDNRWIFWSMLIGAIGSLIASFVLSVEAVVLAGDPAAPLACSVNVIVNCATVALHPTANFLGFPNSFLGLMAEPVVITVALAGLAGVKFPKLFMFFAQIGYGIGFVFAYYLFFISMLVIGALCPWCLLVTATTTFVFFAITRYNIRENNLYLPDNIQAKAKQFIDKDYDKLLLFSLIFLMAAWIVLKYGNALFA